MKHTHKHNRIHNIACSVDNSNIPNDKLFLTAQLLNAVTQYIIQL